MLISRAHYPVESLGYGVRSGIWTQGCSIHCPGCVARDTWVATPESEVPVSEILAWLATHPDVDGITISGGEPLEQAGELLDLLRGIRAASGPDLDVLCYSGRAWRTVARAHPEVLGLMDAIVTGPFRMDRPTRHPLMGSANQQLVLLTDLGRERYGDVSEVDRRPVQTSVWNGELRMVGIPNEGDLAELEAAAAHHGLDVVAPSWKATTG